MLLFVPQQVGVSWKLDAAVLAQEDRLSRVDLPHVHLKLPLRPELLVADRALPCVQVESYKLLNKLYRDALKGGPQVV